MGPSESINRALNAFFNGFGIPGYLEDNIPPAASLPYLTYKPTIPGGGTKRHPSTPGCGTPARAAEPHPAKRRYDQRSPRGQHNAFL